MIPFEELSRQKASAQNLLGVSPEGNGVARDRLTIFGTEADSEVLQ